MQRNEQVETNIFEIRRGTIFIMVLLVMLFAISIQISLELFNQKTIAFKERMRSSVLDTMSIKFRKFEDKYIASLIIQVILGLGNLVDEIEWLESIEVFTVSMEMIIFRLYSKSGLQHLMIPFKLICLLYKPQTVI